MRHLIRAMAATICPVCGWWAEAGHQCHPADR